MAEIARPNERLPRMAAKPRPAAAARAARRAPVRQPPRPPLDSRVIDWVRTMPGQTRSGTGGALLALAAILGIVASTQANAAGPLGAVGALLTALFGWSTLPLLAILTALGGGTLLEALTRRQIVRPWLPLQLGALWAVLEAGTQVYFGNAAGGLAGIVLAAPFGGVPGWLAHLSLPLVAAGLLLAIAHVTPADLRVTGVHVGRFAGRQVGWVAGVVAARLRPAPSDLLAPDEVEDDAEDEPVPAPPKSARAARRSAAEPAAVASGEAQTFAGAGTEFAGLHAPPLAMFAAPPAPAPAQDDPIEQLAQRLEHALRSFRVEAEVRREDISAGPTVIRFGIRPVERPKRDERGRTVLDDDGQPLLVRTRVSRVLSLQDDLALALEATSVRMEAPVPGQAFIGLEIPRRHPRTVRLSEVLASPAFSQAAAQSPLTVALGQDVGGTVRVADLAALPHVLVAGTTGSGKSVWLHAMLCSLLARTTPETVRLLLIDPKQVELTPYNGLPHLLLPVITDPRRVVGALRRVLAEMDRRYECFSRLGVRNLEGYRQLARYEPELEPLPNIVVVIDELADLMLSAPEAVESAICRLAQLARATGIHLVVATQRPSVDVITGTIKANIPSRIAFMVSSAVDSRTILDGGGAERLLGKGDMLFLAADASKPERLQGSFVSDEEVGRLVRYWRAQRLGQADAPPAQGMPAQRQDVVLPALPHPLATAGTPPLEVGIPTRSARAPFAYTRPAPQPGDHAQAPAWQVPWPDDPSGGASTY